MGREQRSYMYSLVRDAQRGDANSFAILYSISYNNIYDKCTRIFESEYDIQDVMFNTYVAAYRSIHDLGSAKHIEKWINILFENQLSLFLKKKGDNIKNYYRKLHSPFRFGKKNLDDEYAEQILESVFMAVNSKWHDVPLSSLRAYHSYRSNRLTLQRGALVIAMFTLVFIPFYMMTPEMVVERSPNNTKHNQAHYTVGVSSFIPVSTVLATQGNKEMTVMIDGDKIYDVRAEQNGKMVITATTINGKSVSAEVEVTGISTYD